LDNLSKLGKSLKLEEKEFIPEIFGFLTLTATVSSILGIARAREVEVTRRVITAVSPISPGGYIITIEEFLGIMEIIVTIIVGILARKWLGF